MTLLKTLSRPRYEIHEPEKRFLFVRLILKRNFYLNLLACLLVCLCFSSTVSSQTASPAIPEAGSTKPVLVKAFMCEGIKDFLPVNPAIAFSIEIGKVSCFVSFDPVPEEMYIVQQWYHRDRLSTKQKLLLKPPRWSTFSTIQLREADKGPWRVEITDLDGNIFQVLKFSIVD